MSKRSQTSAYNMYASNSFLKSSHHSRAHSESSRHRGSDSSDRNEDFSKARNSRTSKSLKRKKGADSSLVDYTDHHLKRFDHLPSSYSKASTLEKHGSSFRASGRDSSHYNKKGSNAQASVKTQSLMDIDFGNNHSVTSAHLTAKWKDYSAHHNPSSDEDHRERSGGQRSGRYSDSDENEDEDFWRKEKSGRTRKTWRESSDMSRHTPLIVDFPEPTRKSGSSSAKKSPEKPKPLLETYVLPPVKKPVSLLDLPSSIPRAERMRHKNHARVKQSAVTSDQSYEDKAHHNHDSDREISPAKKPKLDKGKTESSRILNLKSTNYTYLVIPSICASNHLHGRAKLTVLLGNVRILAYRLKLGVVYDVYSPASSSLLALTVDESKPFKTSDVIDVLLKEGLTDAEKELSNLEDNTVAVLRLEKLESAMCDYVTTFIPYTQLFIAGPVKDAEWDGLKGVNLSKLGMKVAPYKEMASSCMNLTVEYDEVLARWSERVIQGMEAKKPPIVLCCGPKNSGKSTFNRLLLNTALESVDSIAYLECDVGQTEFSPPGTMALHVINQPIMAVPFCHQKQSERMVFYGDASPSQDPTLYMECLQFVFEAYRGLNCPLVVNTMGFPEGIGLMLLVSTMRITEPDMVIQLETFNQALNFPAITQELVALDEGWTYNKLSVMEQKQKVAETKQHELIFLSSLVSQRRDFSLKLKPADLRNLSLISALSTGLERGMTLTSLTPYTVPYMHLGIHLCHHHVPPEGILAAIDCSVVALCIADLSLANRESNDLPFTFSEMPICQCLGLGIVRGVDTSHGLLYIVTTLPRMYFRRANTILKGSLTIPDQIILKQKSSKPAPYIDSLAPSTAVSSVRPRSRMPRLSLGGAQ